MRFEVTWVDELAFEADRQRYLEQGTVLVRGVTQGLVAGAACELAISHPSGGQGVEVQGMAVHFSGNGVVVALSDAGPLRAWLSTLLAPATVDSDEVPSPEVPSPVATEQIAEPGDGSEADAAGPGGTWRRGVNLHATERVRKISAIERRKLARTGNQQERVALERAFGKEIWELLLSNPKITGAEVATIARKGSVPVPLIETIVAKRAWIATSVVRRALLTNPRLRGKALEQVLRATPKSELKLMPRQGSYTPAVRQAASRLLKVK